MRVNLGHIGNNINSNMLIWFTYGGPADMSQQAAFIMAQVLAVLIGLGAFVVTIYGLIKYYTREK